MEEISILLQDEKVLQTKSWTHEGIPDAEISFSGYSLYRTDRKSHSKIRGGGCLLYIRDNLTASKVVIGEGTESVWVKLRVNKNEELTIGVCYKSPTDTMDQVCKMMEAIKLASTGHCLIMGDFNYSNIDWITGEANGDGLEFMNLINYSFLFQNVKNATRGNNILDLV